MKARHSENFVGIKWLQMLSERFKKIRCRISEAGDAKNNFTKIVCGYTTAKVTIYSLHMCNDSTVRGIKLDTDILHLSHKEENLQNRVFVVEDKTILKNP